MEMSIETRCPHSITQCPSPKKGLAHAIVQCNIHLGRIVDPRILPCGHSFCFRCLRVLHEEQKPTVPKNATPTTGLVLTCPLCRRQNHLNSIEELTVNFAISDLLEIFDAEEKEEERVRRETLSEMEHTIGILKSLKEKCDQKLKLGKSDQFYIDCLKDAIIATDKKISYLENLALEIDEEKDRFLKDRLIRNLHFTSLAYQRLAEMFDGEMQLSNGIPAGLIVEEIELFLRMYKNAIVLEYRPTETMTERRSRVWFTIIFSLLIRQFWPALENRNFAEVAKQLSLEFSQKFDDVKGVWIAVVGRRPLGCWIWKDEHDYACLDVAEYRLVIYRRDLAETHEKSQHTLTRTNLDKILTEAVQLKEKDGRHDLNVAKFVRERLQRESDGFFWHTAAGLKNDFGIFASTSGKEIDLEFCTSQVGNWKTVVWEG